MWWRTGSYVFQSSRRRSSAGSAARAMSRVAGARFNCLRQQAASFFAGRWYEIGRTLCDYFGTNVTWNVDGWLRLVSLISRLDWSMRVPLR